MRLAGFVLVGGGSARMGSNKARLPVASHLLAEDVAAKVTAAVGNATLIGDPASYSDLPFDCIPDLRPNSGPLAGIEAALASKSGELNLILACDMPGLKSEWLSWLIAEALLFRNRCVVSRDAAGKIHPLCAIYSSGCLPVVETALETRRLKLLATVEILEPGIVDIPDIIHNVNSPSEWASWQTLNREKTSQEVAPISR